MGVNHMDAEAKSIAHHTGIVCESYTEGHGRECYKVHVARRVDSGGVIYNFSGLDEVSAFLGGLREGLILVDRWKENGCESTSTPKS